MNLKEKFTSYWNYLAIANACKLNIFDYIDFQYNTRTKLVEVLSCEIETINLLFDYLIEAELLIEKDNVFELTKLGKQLTENHPKSLKYSCILWSDEHLTAWQNLDYTLKTGKSAFDKLYKKTFFDYIADKPDKLKIYHKALNEYARDDYENICEILDIEDGYCEGDTADIGGGLGALLSIIKKNKAKIPCYLFERKEVLDLIKKSTDFEKIEVNFFETFPKRFLKQFIYHAFLCRVLHDWDDENALIILRNVNEILNEKAKLYIIESVKNVNKKQNSILDLNMRVMTKGFERTLDDFKILLEKANYIFVNTKKINETYSIITFRPSFYRYYKQ